MKKIVEIVMESRQSIPGEDTLPVFVRTEGTWYEKNGAHYLLFEETGEDGAVTQSRARIRPERFDIKKSGEVATHLFFEEGKTHEAGYETPFGSIPISVRTEKLVAEIGDESLLVELWYRISHGGGAEAECRMRFSAQEKSRLP